MSLSLEEVDVPNSQQGKQHRNVLLQWSRAEVLILDDGASNKNIVINYTNSVQSVFSNPIT